MKKVFMSAAIVAMMAAAVACGNNNAKKAEEAAAEEPAVEAEAPAAEAEELNPLSAAIKSGVEQVEGAVTETVVEGVNAAASSAADAIKK